MNFEIQDCQFTRIDEKIAHKSVKIEELFQLDLIKINERYMTDHANNINNQRSLMLTQLTNKRDSELCNINELKEKQTDLNAIQVRKTELKSKQVAFKKSAYLNPDIVLNKFDFGEYDLHKAILNKSFLFRTKKFSLKLPQKWEIQDMHGYQKFLYITPSKLFLCVQIKARSLAYRMLVIDKTGSILHQKPLLNVNESESKYKLQFKASSRHILRLFKANDSNKQCMRINLYDFKLNLYFTFDLSPYHHFDIVVGGGDEFAFKPDDGTLIYVFKSDTAELSSIQLPFLMPKDKRFVHGIEVEDRLVYLDKRFVCVSKFDRRLKEYLIYMLSRESGFGYGKMPIKLESSVNLFDKRFKMYNIDARRHLLLVFKLDGEFVGKVRLTPELKSLRFSSFHSIVCNISISQDFIEFEEY